MTEDDLRSDYWVDNRSDRAFPLWLVFRQLGQEAGVQDGLPYIRPDGPDVVAVLKQLEAVVDLPEVLEKLGLTAQAAHALMWYLVWLVERSSPNPDWTEWNRRVDAAWQSGILG